MRFEKVPEILSNSPDRQVLQIIHATLISIVSNIEEGIKLREYLMALRLEVLPD